MRDIFRFARADVRQGGKGRSRAEELILPILPSRRGLFCMKMEETRILTPGIAKKRSHPGMLQWAMRHRHGEIVGTAVVDGKTKHLLKRIRPGQIAVIHHRDLDEVAAMGLVEKRVRAVINGDESISGIYPTPGPGRLLAAHIPGPGQGGECVGAAGRRDAPVDRRGLLRQLELPG